MPGTEQLADASSSVCRRQLAVEVAAKPVPDEFPANVDTAETPREEPGARPHSAEPGARPDADVAAGAVSDPPTMRCKERGTSTSTKHGRAQQVRERANTRHCRRYISMIILAYQ